MLGPLFLFCFFFMFRYVIRAYMCDCKCDNHNTDKWENSFENVTIKDLQMNSRFYPETSIKFGLLKMFFRWKIDYKKYLYFKTAFENDPYNKTKANDVKRGYCEVIGVFIMFSVVLPMYLFVNLFKFWYPFICVVYFNAISQTHISFVITRTHTHATNSLNLFSKMCL